MMVLVACEESQRVCEAFRMRWHEAYSADIQEPSGGHPEWHILGDVLPIIQVSLIGTKVCVENPLPLKHFGLPRYSQIIHPYYFGEPWSKRTCFWLVGLPLLIPTNILERHEPWVNTRGHNGHSGRNPKIRAKTFRGIAKAMAEQWG